MAMHLLVMAFLSVFGYKRQQCKAEAFAYAASMVQNPACWSIVSWLPRHDLATTKAVRQMVENIAPYLPAGSTVNLVGFR